MPVAKDKYNLRPFKEAPLSTSPIKPIELEAVDLSLYKDGAENLPIRQKLATQIEKSLSTYGFIMVTNHGFPHDKLEFLKSLAQGILEVPLESQNHIWQEH